VRRGRSGKLSARGACQLPRAARSTRTLGGRLRRRAVTQQEIDDLVQIITKGANAAPDVLARAENARRTTLARELRRYGEDRIASLVESLPSKRVESIYGQHFKFAYAGKHAYLSLCMAAVEEIEGNARPLARKRRKSAT
jgi:hypothetical protein